MLAHMDPNQEKVLVRNGFDLLKHAWHFDPLAVAGVALTVLLYLWLVRFRIDRHTYLFLGGNAVILLALTSPIATIGETYLFSVHMVQHLLLEIVAVPLIILGTPPKLAARLMRLRILRNLADVLQIPLIAWLVGIATLWIWHWPLLYNLTLEIPAVHILEHLCFIVSATIFWAALLDPVEKYRLKMVPAFVYLFSAALINTLLAILLTFAPAGIYPYYLHPKDPLGALALIRGQWGIDPAMDQQMGGAVMWVMGGIVFTLILLTIVVRWYQSPEEEHYDGIQRSH